MPRTQKLRKYRMLLPLALLLTLLSGAVAQAAPDTVGPRSVTIAPQDVPTQQAAMQKLSFMVGRWVGSGWNLTSTGVRQNFNQTEKVKYRVQGLVITVDGQGTDPADPHRIVDSALAVLNYNDSTAQYRWEAFSQGFVTVAIPVVGTNTFQWSIVQPGVTIRYTLTFTATTWHEIGEVSTDGGTTWHQNFQMDLVRVH